MESIQSSNGKRRSRKPGRRSFLTAALFGALLLCGAGLSLTHVLALGAEDCPEAGSGADGVQEWYDANIGAGCDDLATTCNGEFTIEYRGREVDGTEVTFKYQVCRVDARHGLSHWGIGLFQIECLRDGASLDELVVGATFDGSELIRDEGFEVGLDPNTQLFGIKFDEGFENGCVEFTVTFDRSALEEGLTLVEGCVLASTKASNQDIEQTDRDSPGYAIIKGPVCGPLEEEEFGPEGLSPGFWKNHTDLWTFYGPGDKVGHVEVFDAVAADPFHNNTLLEALNFGGGPGVDGAKRILLRAAVAALLNAEHPDVDYPRTGADVIDDVNAALGSGDRATILALATELDADNNLGHPTGIK